jgi:hypothetical protein
VVGEQPLEVVLGEGVEDAEEGETEPTARTLTP